MGVGYETLNVTTLILIAIGMVLAVVVILWGARLSRRRKSAQAEVEADQGTTSSIVGELSDNDATDVAAGEAPQPAAVEPTASTPSVHPLPVAPAPPPLVEGEFIATAAEVPHLSGVQPAASTGEDDFTRLKGLGPKVAARLGELGITTYTQLASLSPAEAEAIDAQLGPFKGRMMRDRWVEQAGYLAQGDIGGFEAAFGKL